MLAFSFRFLSIPDSNFVLRRVDCKKDTSSFYCFVFASSFDLSRLVSAGSRHVTLMYEHMRGEGHLHNESLQTFDDWLEVVEDHVLLADCATAPHSHRALVHVVTHFPLYFFESLPRDITRCNSYINHFLLLLF